MLPAMSVTSTPRRLHVEHVMGTVFSLDVRSPSSPDEAIEQVVSWLHEVDATFSTYREESAIRRLDRGAVTLAEVGPEHHESFSL